MEGSFNKIAADAIKDFSHPQLNPQIIETDDDLFAQRGIIGFYYPDEETDIDLICQSGFLGNFFDLSLMPLSPMLINLNPPAHETSYTFRNSESAFQALKFWDYASKFSPLSGNEAFQLKRSLTKKGLADWSYAGYGGNYQGMMACLKIKFAPETLMANALLKTGDAWLQERNIKVGRDNTWSDNGDGTGKNWLGIQLMLLRDELKYGSSASSIEGTWTSTISSSMDISNGSQLTDNTIQAYVTRADAYFRQHIMSSKNLNPSRNKKARKNNK